MDGLHRLINPGAAFEIGGRCYRLSPAVGTLAAYAEIEREVLRRREDPLAAAAAVIGRFPPESRDALVQSAIRQAAQRKAWASRTEIAEFLDTFAGTAFLFWLAVRAAHPEVASPRDAERLLGELPCACWADLQAALDEAAGVDSLKNSTGRVNDPAETMDQTHPATIGFPGPESIES